MEREFLHRSTLESYAPPVKLGKYSWYFPRVLQMRRFEQVKHFVRFQRMWNLFLTCMCYYMSIFSVLLKFKIKNLGFGPSKLFLENGVYVGT